MSKTLNLLDRLLTLGRRYQELGRNPDAVRVLCRLASFRELPPPVAEETQVRLAEIQLRRRKYRQARRHLTAALLYQPENARYHYLMASALEGDAKGDRSRALEHYHKSLEIQPDQPRCLADLGLLALSLDQNEEGLRCLNRAAELAPNDPATVGKLAEGLSQLDRADEARSVLRAARFRNPRDARFTRLWNDFQFRQLRARQQAERKNEGVGARDEGPVLLPLVGPIAQERPARQVVRGVRRDRPSTIGGPHIFRPTLVPDQKHAP